MIASAFIFALQEQILAHLVEPVLATITDVDDFDDLGLQPLVQEVTLTELGLEIGRASKYQTGDVDFVVGDEVLDSQLADLANVVVTLLVSETGKTKSGLTTTTMLLREIDGELVHDFTSIAGDGSKERAITVHDDETESLVRLQ